MATVVTRAGKGSALTHTEMDANTTNLNTELVLKPDTNTTQSWTAQQNFTEVTVTDATSITWNLDTDQVGEVTLAGNRTLTNATNQTAGGTSILRITQDGTGSRTLGYGSAYKFPAGVDPVLTTTAGAVDILSCVSDGTNMYCNMLLDMK